MAIQLDLASSQYGISFAGAYFRIVTATISRMRGDDPKFTVMIDVVGYATATPGDDTREVDFRRHHALASEVYAQNSDTFMGQCYAWVKAQPEYADAVDC